MILRRYGTSVQSVEAAFDSRALTEIGFRRDRRASLDGETFEREYRKVDERALAATAEGSVQDEVERSLLDEILAQIEAYREALDEGEVLLVESEPGRDYPRTHTRQRTVVERGENRLHFEVSVDPPLRLGRYRREGGT